MSSSRSLRGTHCSTRAWHRLAGSAGRAALSAVASRAIPALNVSSRRSTSPSVNNTTQLPGAKVTTSSGTVAHPQAEQGARYLAEQCSPSRRARAAGGVDVRRGNSGMSSFGGVDDDGRSGGQWFFHRAAQEPGRGPLRARPRVRGPGTRARAALRICPMVIAASSPWPATSPTMSVIWPFGSSMASYQSPPMP